MPFKITSNTDAVDIDHQCVGLCATRDTFPPDVRDHIHSNRGLHVQIRHNKDPQTFAQACELSKLFGAAPEMLMALKNIVASAPLTGIPLALEKDIQAACAIISKIEGKG